MLIVSGRWCYCFIYKICPAKTNFCLQFNICELLAKWALGAEKWPCFLIVRRSGFVQCKKQTKHILGWLQLLVFVAQQQETNIKYQSNWLDSSLFLFEGNLELFSELKCTRITTLF